MSMYNDIEWEAKGNKERCEYKSQTVADLCSQIPSRSLVFLGAWIRRKVVRNLHWRTWRIMESISGKHDGKFHRIRSSTISCLQRLWEKRNTKQGRRKEVNTLQWYQWKYRVASPHSDFCERAQYLRSRSRFMQRSIQRFQVSEETCSTAMEEPSARIWVKIRTIVQKTRSYPNYVLMRVWSLSQKDNTSILLIQKNGRRCNIYVENTQRLEMKRGLVWEDGFARIQGSAQSWT